MADLITPEYKQLLQRKHIDKPWGGAGKSWIPRILPLINGLPSGPITVLDYGCGRGTLKPELEALDPMVRVSEYDPGVPGKDVLEMRPVDIVVCTDVMEHVEEQYVVKTLQTINWLAINCVFFNIDTGESKSFLPDGRNTHITIKPSSWWRANLNKYIPDMEWTVHEETRFRVVLSGRRQNHVE